MYITGSSREDPYTLYNSRAKAPVRWKFTGGFEVALYMHEGQVRVDFTRKGERKHSSVSLKVHQMTTLYHIRDMLTGSVRSYKNVMYDLGGLLYASHEVFRDVWTVNLRQYYVDDEGDQKPGRDGVNIPQTIWTDEILRKLQEICEYHYIIHGCHRLNGLIEFDSIIDVLLMLIINYIGLIDYSLWS